MTTVKIVLVFLFAIQAVLSNDNVEEVLERLLEDRSFRSKLKRIIGGEETMTDEEQGFLVSIRGKAGGFWWSKKYVFCGGSVISDHWILTAAHCFDSVNSPGKWTVRLASRKRSGGVFDKIGHWFGKITGNKDWQEFERDVDKIIIHEGYNPKQLWHHDIALMKMDEPVPSGKDFAQIRAISLPKQEAMDWPEDNQDCLMMGWGCDKAGGTVVGKTMRVHLPKVSDRECQQTWGIKAKTRLCAGENYHNKGICPGDSGGPLVARGPNGEWVQAGIASFTSARTPGQRPGAFTRVSMYVNWIKNTMNSN